MCCVLRQESFGIPVLVERCLSAGSWWPKKDVGVKVCNTLTRQSTSKILWGRLNRRFPGFDEEKVTILYKSLVRKDYIDMESMQERRLQTSLVESNKFINELYKTPSEKFFSLPHKDLRRHSKKLIVGRTRTKSVGHFISNRVVKHWNNVPETLNSAPFVAIFKSNLRVLPIDEEN